jgi:nitrite reductase (NADH) small subunit
VDDWVEVGAVEAVRRARKRVIDVDGTPVVLFWHADRAFALQNICIHRERELVKGVILNDRIVCPGHQWAFDLETGFEDKVCRWQPTFDVKVDDGVVYVARTPRDTPRPATIPPEALPQPQPGSDISLH